MYYCSALINVFRPPTTQGSKFLSVQEIKKKGFSKLKSIESYKFTQVTQSWGKNDTMRLSWLKTICAVKSKTLCEGGTNIRTHKL